MSSPSEPGAEVLVVEDEAVEDEVVEDFEDELVVGVDEVELAAVEVPVVGGPSELADPQAASRPARTAPRAIAYTAFKGRCMLI
jgi:hypothetical protein